MNQSLCRSVKKDSDLPPGFVAPMEPASNSTDWEVWAHLIFEIGWWGYLIATFGIVGVWYAWSDIMFIVGW